MRKNCSSDREKLAKFLRSLEQFIQTVKGQKNFWYVTECFFGLALNKQSVKNKLVNRETII